MFFSLFKSRKVIYHGSGVKTYSELLNLEKRLESILPAEATVLHLSHMKMVSV
jgi:hypothetical protein